MRPTSNCRRRTGRRRDRWRLPVRRERLCRQARERCGRGRASDARCGRRRTSALGKSLAAAADRARIHWLRRHSPASALTLAVRLAARRAGAAATSSGSGLQSGSALSDGRGLGARLARRLGRRGAVRIWRGGRLSFGLGGLAHRFRNRWRGVALHGARFSACWCSAATLGFGRSCFRGLRLGRRHRGAGAGRRWCLVAADVDAPAGQLGGQARVLALAPDGEREHALRHGDRRRCGCPRRSRRRRPGPG